MTESTSINENSNTNWNFLNYPIHTVCAKPKELANDITILLIHGFGASTDHWRFNIPVLSSKFEVHAIDLLGFGKSPKPNDVDYSGSLWKDQVVSYVKEKIKKPTIIVGNSLGGYAALAAGAELQDLSAGVILLAAGTKGKRKIGKNCRLMIHSVIGGNHGPLHNLLNEMEAVEQIQKMYIDCLVAETNLSKKQLKKLLERKVNVYLSAEEAVEYGIADIII